MIKEKSLDLVEITEFQDEVLKKIIRIMKEIDIKDASREKQLSALVQDSLDLMELRLALENNFSDELKPLTISEIDARNMMKMTIEELAIYISNQIDKNSFNVN